MVSILVQPCFRADQMFYFLVKSSIPLKHKFLRYLLERTSLACSDSSSSVTKWVSIDRLEKLYVIPICRLYMYCICVCVCAYKLALVSVYIVLICYYFQTDRVSLELNDGKVLLRVSMKGQTTILTTNQTYNNMKWTRVEVMLYEQTALDTYQDGDM